MVKSFPPSVQFSEFGYIFIKYFFSFFLLLLFVRITWMFNVSFFKLYFSIQNSLSQLYINVACSMYNLHFNFVALRMCKFMPGLLISFMVIFSFWWNKFKIFCNFPLFLYFFLGLHPAKMSTSLFHNLFANLEDSLVFCFSYSVHEKTVLISEWILELVICCISIFFKMLKRKVIFVFIEKLKNK